MADGSLDAAKAANVMEVTGGDRNSGCALLKEAASVVCCLCCADGCATSFTPMSCTHPMELCLSCVQKTEP